MSMESVDNHMVIKFSDMMHVKAQQIKARLRPYVEYRDFKNADVLAYDGLGQVEAREIFGRNQPVQFDDLEHNRRKMTRRQFSVTLPMDQYDIEGRLSDPQGLYAQEVLAAMERAFDLVCIDAMFKDVQTGRDFTNTVNFAADGGLTIDATAGLTLAKLLQLQANFIDAEVGIDQPRKIILGLSGDERTQLLQILQLTSRDYSNAFSLEKGQLTSVMGMDIVWYGANAQTPQLSTTGAGGTRTCFALSEGGLCVGMARDWQITIKDRPDLNNVKQLQVTGVLGAVRTEGRRIQKLLTTDI